MSSSLLILLSLNHPGGRDVDRWCLCLSFSLFFPIVMSYDAFCGAIKHGIRISLPSGAEAAGPAPESAAGQDS